MCQFVTLRGLCCFVFCHLFQGTWIPCQEVDMSGGATNDVYFCLILSPGNLPSKLPQPLWTSCEFIPSPYGRERGTDPQRAEGFACLWFVAADAGGSWDGSRETVLHSVYWGGLLWHLVLAGVGQKDNRLVCACWRPLLPWEDTLRREQWWHWEVETQWEIEIWLTGWWRFVSPLDVLIHVICFSYESNIKKLKKSQKWLY